MGGLLVCGTSAAQTLTTVTGSVEDATDAVVPGAAITITSRATGEVREAFTDRTGRFRIDVPAGEYTLRAKVGELDSGNTSVTVGAAPVEVHVRLRVELSEQVTVTAGRQDALAPVANANAVAFDESLFRQLPADGDNILSLVSAFLAPAAVGANGVSIIVDGVETDELDAPSWVLKDVLVNSNPFSAAFQHPGTSRIEITTKQPSRRRFRGTLSLFARNSTWAVQDPFAVDKPPLDRRLIEGGLSGPLPFDHASFFVNGSHLGQHAAAIVNAQTPGGALIQNVPADHEHTNVVARVDGRPSGLNTATIFYTATDDRQTADGVGGFTLSEHGTAPHTWQQRVRIADQAILSPHLTNMAQVSIGWQDRRVGSLPSSPSLIVNGAFTGGPASTFRHDRETTVELNDAAIYARGVHTLQFGSRVRLKTVDAFDQSNTAGTFRFASLSAFRAATPFAFQVSEGSGDISFRDVRASAYAQDDMRPRDDLSVLVGLRYDWQSLLTDRVNLGPRVSAAFTPAHGRTVVRAGAGLFFDHLPDAARRRALLFGGDRIRQVVVLNPSYPGGLDPAAVAPPSVIREDAHLETPTIVDVNVSVERPVGTGVSIAVTLERLRGRHLFRSRDLNAPVPGTGARPNPDFLNITQIESSAAQDSHALIVVFKGQMGHVFRGTAQYRLSKTTNDTAGLFVLPADSHNLAAEEGRADFDRRHQLNFVGTWSLPSAFKIGAVVTLASGLPYDITTGSDDNHDGVANDRPTGVTRNTGRGPALAQVDLRLSRLFRVPAPVRRDRPPRNLDLNVDMFNAFNRVNFADFVGVQTSPFFGRANAALQPRTVQLSVKYHF